MYTYNGAYLRSTPLRISPTTDDVRTLSFVADREDPSQGRKMITCKMFSVLSGAFRARC